MIHNTEEYILYSATKHEAQLPFLKLLGSNLLDMLWISF